jgi:cytochrome oxidase Cu insertion factor (SCO1/SenC/PrrC family)
MRNKNFMKKMISYTKIFLSVIGLGFLPSVLFAQDEIQKQSTDSTVTASNPNLNYFTNTLLVNQHGEEFRFYQDLLEDKTVVISVFFTECDEHCTNIIKIMQKIRDSFKDEMGESLRLLSITVDPENDTPETVEAYFNEYTAGSGWHFLSGDLENVNAILRILGKYVDQRESHNSILLVGNVSTGLWKKVNGLADPGEIIESVKSVLEDRQ